MSFIDDSIKNVKNSVLKEVTVAGGVGGFVGRGGVEIDQLFAGGYHPDSGHGSQNEKLLQKQIEDRKKKRNDMENQAAEQGIELVGNDSPIGGYFDVETEFALNAYDELISRNELNKQYSDAMTPILDTEWKSTGWDYNFDDEYEYAKEENFINSSEKNFKKVGVDIKYDDKEEYAGEDYINKSSTNWKYIR